VYTTICDKVACALIRIDVPDFGVDALEDGVS
jgi:hypothetical protein